MYKVKNKKWEHLTFAAKLEIGVRNQERVGKKSEARRKKPEEVFYKYEMLPLW
ncbi:hypothetical protein QUA43_25210 [Microcoleus sp. N9_B4]|uniref:hypothetical protein n=1 Tax=Microcoleus sp. N9_B4 TaxID=3055386 RepID=UPI002FD02A1D